MVKCPCYLADLSDFRGFNTACGEFFPEPRPARSTVGARLLKGVKIEIDVMARVPAGRWGTPEDLKGAVVYLCSPAADFVNGINLVVDGGWMGR